MKIGDELPLTKTLGSTAAYRAFPDPLTRARPWGGTGDWCSCLVLACSVGPHLALTSMCVCGQVTVNLVRKEEDYKEPEKPK